MNVYDIANDLAQQIKKSEEYVNYKMAREAIKLNSKLSEEIKNFDQLRYQTSQTDLPDRQDSTSQSA